MSKSLQQIQVFYEIAMSIGKSLNLEEMLKCALSTYLRKLDCVAGIVYQLKQSGNSLYFSENIFSAPEALKIKENYKEIDGLFSKPLDETDLANLLKTLPTKGTTNTNGFYHTMRLGDFGFLVLIKSNKPLNKELLLALNQINLKLAQACLACLNNESLKESEEKAQKIGDSALEAVIMISPEGKVDYWNKAAEKMFGHLEKEMLGENVHELIMPKKYKTLFDKGWKNFKNTGKGNAIGTMVELTALRKSGEEFPVEIALSTVHIKGKFGAIAYIRDISERHKAQKVLVESKKRYLDLIEFLPEMICETDLRGKLTFANNYAINKLGYTKSVLYQDFPMLNIFHPDDHEKLKQNFITTLKSNNCPPIEYRAITQKGEVFTVIVYINRLLKNGRIRGIRGVMIDISARKRTEELLLQSEENFRTLFATMDDMLFIGSNNGNISHVNDAVYNKLGYSHKELIKMRMLDVYPKNKQASAERIFGDMFAGKQSTCPIPLQRKDGTLVPAETHIWNGKWNGKDCIFGIAKDLSKEQEALQKFNKIFNNNPTMMTVTTLPERTIVDVNSAFLKVMGYKREEVLDKTALEINFYKDPAKHIKLHEGLQKAGHVSNFDMEAITKDGKTIKGLLSSEIIESNGKLFVLTVITDLTAQKDTEAKLLAKTKLQQILMNISLTYINIPLTEINNAIQNSLKEIGEFVNADRSYIFDYDFEKQTTSNTYEWCQEGISPKIDDLQKVSIENVSYWVDLHKIEQVMLIEDVYTLPSDSKVRKILKPQKVKSIIAIPLISGGESIGFIGFDWIKNYHTFSDVEKTLLELFAQLLVNIKNRVALETNLTKEKKNAEAANLAKSEFLSTMSHEIRTPMNAILGFSEALYHKLDSKEHKHMIKTVLSSGNLLLALLNDILDLSKIEAGKMELELHPIDIENILQEIRALFVNKAQKKGIEFNLYIDAGLPKALVLDEIRIKQIIFNLVGNALKFTHKGFININVSFNKINKDIGNLILEIEDTGIGISKSQQQLIFDPFMQQSGQSTRMYQGIGLGLAISKRLIEKMEGEISVKSIKDLGSTFKISIPNVKIVKTEIRKKKTRAKVQNVVFNNCSVLIVDDVATNIEMIETLLSPTGLHTSSAENGEVALEILDQTTPDLILLDIRMPGMDGYEVAKRIKENPDKKHIPIIACTASVFSSKKIEKSTDFNGFLHKPIKMAELFSQLSKYLKHKTETPTKEATKPDGPSLDNLPEDIMGKLPEIETVLKESFYPRWEAIKDSLALFNIEDFAVELKKMAQKYDFQFLIEYANKIIEDVNMVDLESLKGNLSNFPGVIKKISQLLNK